MQDINSLLDLTLEIEGLLRVLAIRDDAHVRQMVQQKASDLAAALGANQAEADKPEPCIDESALPDMASMAAAAVGMELQPEVDNIAPTDDDHIAEPAENMTDGHGDEPIDESIDIDSDFSIDILECEADEEQEYSSESTPAEQPMAAEEQPAIPAEPTPQPVAPAAAASAAKSFITFNEKYRFARELFGNQHAKLSEVLSEVTAMSSLSEAHEYVLNTLKLDEENPVVIEFLEVIARHFNSRS